MDSCSVKYSGGKIAPHSDLRVGAALLSAQCGFRGVASSAFVSDESAPAIIVMSINIGGFSSEKGDIVGEYCKRVKSDILCVQETHRSEIHNQPSFRGIKLAVEIPHGKHGSAIFTNPRLEVLSRAVRNVNDMGYDQETQRRPEKARRSY